jgi:hypothetical protein
LVAEMVVVRPGPLLGELREATGVSALVMPRTLGGLVANFFGLPIRVAEHVEDEKPLTAAAALRKREVHVAAAAHVKRGFVEQATRGEDGSFIAERDGDLTWLKAGPKARRALVPGTLAVVDDCLVVGTSREAVTLLGPYLARTVAPGVKQDAAGTHIDVRAGALAKLFEAIEPPKLPAPWSSIADPKEILAAMRDIARELGAGEVTLDLAKDALVMEARFDAASAEAGRRLAKWPTMPARALLDVPSDTVAAAIWVEDAEARHQRAKARADALSELVGDAKDDLRKALEALSRGRGADTRIGLRCTGVGLTGFASGSVADKKAIDEGLKTALALGDHAAVKKLLHEKDLDLESKKTRIERVPIDVWRLRLKPDDKDETREVIDLLGGADESRYLVAAGMETIDTLQRLHEKETPEKPNEAMRAAVRRLGDKLWFGVLGDPQGLHACLQGKPGGSFTTPVSLGAAPDEKRARLRLHIARPLLRLVSTL